MSDNFKWRDFKSEKTGRFWKDILTDSKILHG